jgi:hypothetical protein
MNAKALLAVVVVATMLFAPGGALAADQCFSMFNGSVIIEFNNPVSTTATPLNGRIFGGLSSCDGLVSWPVVGSAHHSKGNGLVLAWRAFTVDDTVCGATDWIALLNGKPLSGPVQLWNQRTNFGNTTTMSVVSCPKLPKKPTPPAGVDPLGNYAH